MPNVLFYGKNCKVSHPIVQVPYDEKRTFKTGAFHYLSCLKFVVFHTKFDVLMKI